MRADWDQDHGIGMGMQYRAATGHRVSGRAGWRGNDEAVGSIMADQLAVDVDAELDHASGIPFLEHHVVQSDLTLQYLVVVTHGRFQQKALVGDEFSRQYQV